MVEKRLNNRLKTNVLSDGDQVTVGVLSSASEFSKAMSASWQTDGIEIVELTADSDKPEAGLYKIFIYCQPEDITPQFTNLLAKKFFAYSEKCYFVLHVPYEKNPEGERLLQFITKIQQRLPFANIVLWQDVVSKTLFSALKNSQVHFLLSETYPCLLDDVTEQLKRYSVKHKGGKRALFRGEKNYHHILKAASQAIVFNSTLAQLGEKYATQTVPSSIKLEEFVSKPSLPVAEKSAVVSSLPKPRLKKPSVPVVEKKVEKEKKTEPSPSEVKVKREEVPSKEVRKINKTGKKIVIPPVVVPEIRRSKIVLDNISKKKIATESREEQTVKTALVDRHPAIKKKIDRPAKAVTQAQSQHPVDVKIAQIFSRSVPKKQLTQFVHQPSSTPSWLSKHPVVWKASLVPIVVASSMIGLFFLSSSTTNALYTRSFELSSTKSISRQGSVLKKLYEWQLTAYKPALGIEFVQEEKEKIAVIDQMVTVSDLQKSFVETLSQLVSGVFAEQPDQQLTRMSTLSTQSDELYKTIGRVEPLIQNSANTSVFVSFLQGIKSVKKQALLFQQFYPVMYDMLGKNGARTIAVLIQDNQEIRPAGGYIEGVLLLKTDKGKVIDWNVISSQSIDSSLKGSIAPPPDLHQFLKEDRWFFRDSNWKVDFTQTAQQVRQLLQLSLSEEVDYVLAMNQESLQSLLADGNVQEVEGERLTADNFANRHFQYTRKSVEKNDSQSLSLLVFRALLVKLEQRQLELSSTVLSSLYAGLEKGEVLFFSAQSQYQSTIESIGWAGSLYTPSCPTVLYQEPCLVRSIAQFDTNVGVNKANYYIKKQTNHTIHIEKDKTVSNYISSYESGTQDISWPGGIYKNYYRLAIPRESSLEAVIINGQNVDSDKILKYLEGEFRIVGVYVEVPPQSKTTVEVRYSEKGMTAPFTYVVFHQHQPGVQVEKNSITIRPPKDAVPLIIAPEASIAGESITYQTDQSAPFLVGVKLQ